jgi:hypothetical protein
MAKSVPLFMADDARAGDGGNLHRVGTLQYPATGGIYYRYEIKATGSRRISEDGDVAWTVWRADGRADWRRSGTGHGSSRICDEMQRLAQEHAATIK